MIPKITQTDTAQVPQVLKLVGDPVLAAIPAPGPGPAVSKLRPDLRKAFDEIWPKDEEALRYLAR